ncbi:serine esterase, putative [Babesia caballi]|uniref:Serine esterase, putative n=1 Tax=Babesia caballi TaxID=5871 RepID=A0AAV4LYZ9_BABCB|nr:serine esterase, putative [Babesia caballi]
MADAETPNFTGNLCYHCRVRATGTKCFGNDTSDFYDAVAVDTQKRYWELVSEQVMKEKNRARNLANVLSAKVIEIVKFLGKSLADMPLDMEYSKELQFDLFAMPECIGMCPECYCFFSRQHSCHCKECMGEDYVSHYVLLQHGVIAEPFCMASVAKSLLTAYPNLFVYFPNKVAGKSLVGLELVLQMFASEILTLFSKLPKKIKLSVMGHSFGGIILRYWLFFYHRKTPGVYTPLPPSADEQPGKEGGEAAEEDEKLAKAPEPVHIENYEPPEITWCNYISLASPQAGIYENNAAFRKFISLVGSRSIDELDNESADLLLLISSQALETMRQFGNVAVYGNLSGDLLVAPRTSILLPRHKVTSAMLAEFVTFAEADPGEPLAIWDLMAKYDSKHEPGEMTPSEGEELDPSLSRDEVVAKLLVNFYSMVANNIRKSAHINKLMNNSDKPFEDGEDEMVCRQLFSAADIEYFTMLVTQIGAKASQNLIAKLHNYPKLMYNEVMLAGLWEVTHNKFAVFLPAMCMPHKSIITPIEMTSWHKLTEKVLDHARVAPGRAALAGSNDLGGAGENGEHARRRVGDLPLLLDGGPVGVPGLEELADVAREHLAQLDAHLVEGVDAPEEALDGDAVLVEGDERADGVGRGLLEEQDGGGPVAGADLVVHQVLGAARSQQLLGGPAVRQGVGLREEVGHELLVEGHAALGHVPVLAPDEADELGGDDAALVQQLVEAVLAVGAALAEVDLAGAVGQPLAVHADGLAVALHAELLDVAGEEAEVLAVGQQGHALQAEDGGVVEAAEGHQRGHVLLERGAAEVLVHHAGALQKLLGHIVAEVDGERQHSDGRGDAETPPLIAHYESHEKRTTQSQKPKTWESSMPKSLVSFRVPTPGAGPWNGKRAIVSVPVRKNGECDTPPRNTQVAHAFKQRTTHHGAIRVQVLGRDAEPGRIHVGQEADFATFGGPASRLVGHERLRGEGSAQVGTADADAKQRVKGRAVRGDHGAAAHGIRELPDAVEDAVHFGDHVAPVDHELAFAGGAQGAVEDRAAFRAVEHTAVEQHLYLLGDAHFARQRQQGVQSRGIHQLSRQVQRDT